MSRSVRVALQASVLVTFVAGAALALASSHAGVVARAWVLVLALTWAVTLARLVTGAPPDPERRPPLWRRRRLAPVELPSDLDTLQLAVELGMTSEFDRHHRLRPWVVEAAAGLLAGRHGVSLNHDQQQAETLLGPELWALVRPDRPEPPGRGRREMDPVELEAIVASLEALDRR